MVIFLKRYRLEDIKEEEIKTISKPVSIKEIELQLKTFTKVQILRASPKTYIKYLRKK